MPIKNHISIRHFEEFFDEKTLQKALRIVKKQQIIPGGNKGNRQYCFDFSDNTKLIVKRLGENVNFFSCTCERERCEHLCAALFFLQRQTLQMLIDPQQVNKTKTTDQFLKFQRLFKEKKKLLEHSGKGREEVIKGIKKLLRAKNDSFYASLALVVTFQGKNGDEELPKIITAAKEKITRALLIAPDPAAINALARATLVSLSSPAIFKSGIFAFLIPYTALYLRDKNLIVQLKNKLSLRKVKEQSLTGINRKSVAEFHLLLAEERLTDGKKKRGGSSAEYFIARAEQLGLTDTTSAMKVLHAGFKILYENKPVNFTGFVEYAIKASQDNGDTGAELYFTRHLLIHDVFINPNYLNRIKELLGPASQRKYINEILDEIEKTPGNFDKEYALLVFDNRLNDAVKLISRHENKFRQMNELAGKVAPAISTDFLKTYVQQFRGAIGKAAETHYQQLILDSMDDFLSKLDRKTQLALLKDLIASLPKHSYAKQQLEARYNFILQA